MRYTVDHGKIRIAEEWHERGTRLPAIIHFIDSHNFHVFEIDLDSKYPGPVNWEWDDSKRQVTFTIEPNERTLHTRACEEQTTITFHDVESRDWTIMSDASRYTWRIVFYRNEIV